MEVRSHAPTPTRAPPVKKHTYIYVYVCVLYFLIFFPRGGAPIPEVSAIPGRRMHDEEQAPTNHASSKNRLISMVSLETVPEIKPIRTDTTH